MPKIPMQISVVELTINILSKIREEKEKSEHVVKQKGTKGKIHTSFIFQTEIAPTLKKKKSHMASVVPCQPKINYY